MGAIKSFKDLVAWQKAMDLVADVYEMSTGFPSDERFGLTAQTRKAAISIPSNVAEGFGRGACADYMRFIDIAIGSSNELETQLLIAERLGYVPKERLTQPMALTIEVQRILKGLLESLERSDHA